MTDNNEEHQKQAQSTEHAESEPGQEEEEEEEEEGEEEAEEGEEKEEGHHHQVKKDKPTSRKPNNPTISTTKITPKPQKLATIAPKPMSGSPKSQNLATKPIAKRRLDTEKNADESTKKKTKVMEEEEEKPGGPIARLCETEKNADESKEKETKEVKEEEKKPGGPIARLWSEEDEVVILNGIIEFKSKKGIDPSSDTVAFYEFIKKSLSVDVSRSQLMDKVRRLKKKYKNNAKKVEKGEDPDFLKRPHERKCFGISKTIWRGGGGGENEEGGVVTVEGAKQEMKDVKVENVEEFWTMYLCLKQILATNMEDHVKFMLMGNTNMIGKVKAKELEKKCKSLCLDEAALHLRRLKLIREHTNKVGGGCKCKLQRRIRIMCELITAGLVWF